MSQMTSTQPMNKDLDYYLSLPYTIELTPDEDGCWFAEIPLLDGCMTNGESREDALAMIDDAKACHCPGNETRNPRASHRKGIGNVYAFLHHTLRPQSLGRL